MRSTKWGAIVMIVAAAACAKKDAGDDIAADTATVAPAPSAEAPPAPASLPAGATSEMVAQGQQIFTSVGNCYTCHGPDAKGTQLAPDLTDATWLNSSGKLDELVATINTGVPQPKDPSHAAPMPPMGGAQLTADQVKAVAAYVWSLGGGKS